MKRTCIYCGAGFADRNVVHAPDPLAVHVLGAPTHHDWHACCYRTRALLVDQYVATGRNKPAPLEPPLRQSVEVMLTLDAPALDWLDANAIARHLKHAVTHVPGIAYAVTRIDVREEAAVYTPDDAPSSATYREGF